MRNISSSRIVTDQSAAESNLLQASMGPASSPTSTLPSSVNSVRGSL